MSLNNGKQPDKFRNKYRIDSARLKNWDYGSPGFYFVTICTKNRVHYFGDIMTRERSRPNVIHLSPIGAIAEKYWREIPDHFPFVELDTFVIMPNHTHGILFFNKPGYREWKPNQFGPQSQNLASVIRGYKSAVKTYAVKNGIAFAWQSRYHDHVIRSERALSAIRQYIIDNPARWNRDRFNTGLP